MSPGCCNAPDVLIDGNLLPEWQRRCRYGAGSLRRRPRPAAATAAIGTANLGTAADAHGSRSRAVRSM